MADGAYEVHILRIFVVQEMCINFKALFTQQQ